MVSFPTADCLLTTTKLYCLVTDWVWTTCPWLLLENQWTDQQSNWWPRNRESQCHPPSHSIHGTSKVPILWAGPIRYPAFRQLNPLPPPQATRGGLRSKKSSHVPKAQKLKGRSRGPQPCNTEGARGVRQKNRKTNKLSVHCSKMHIEYIWYRHNWNAVSTYPPYSSCKSVI